MNVLIKKSKIFNPNKFPNKPQKNNFDLKIIQLLFESEFKILANKFKISMKKFYISQNIFIHFTRKLDI